MADALTKLAAQFARLPGVGNKTAMRYAYKVLEMSEADAEDFARSITDAKKTIRRCSLCGNYSDTEICPICVSRDRSVICVVKEPRDVAAIEKVREFKGVYHVLHGVLNPMAGIGADDIEIKGLLSRLDGVNEVIMATNPDVEGEATAVYIARLLKPMGIEVTRLAHGIPIGSDIEYADEVTLGRALSERKPL